MNIEDKDMRLFAIVVICLVMSSCTSAVKLRNPTTGETAKCGPYFAVGIIDRDQCLKDYERQGFVRAPD
jgi:uncharacterized protein YceK